MYSYHFHFHNVLFQVWLAIIATGIVLFYSHYRIYKASHASTGVNEAETISINGRLITVVIHNTV